MVYDNYEWNAGPDEIQDFFNSDRGKFYKPFVVPFVQNFHKTSEWEKEGAYHGGVENPKQHGDLSAMGGSSTASYTGHGVGYAQNRGGVGIKRFVYHAHHNFRGNVLAVLEYLGLIFLALSMFMLCEPMKKLHVGAIFVY